MPTIMPAAVCESVAAAPRRPRPERAAIRWNTGRLKLAGKGLALSYFLWACIHLQMPAAEAPASARLAAPAEVSAPVAS